MSSFKTWAGEICWFYRHVLVLDGQISNSQRFYSLTVWLFKYTNLKYWHLKICVSFYDSAYYSEKYVLALILSERKSNTNTSKQINFKFKWIFTRTCSWYLPNTKNLYYFKNATFQFISLFICGLAVKPLNRGSIWKELHQKYVVIIWSTVHMPDKQAMLR